MRRILTAATILLLAVACNSSDMNEGTQRVSVTLAEGPVPAPATAATESSEEIVPKTAEDTDPAAQAPQVIAGAFLSCTPKVGFAECISYNSDRQVMDFNAAKAFVVQGSPLVWKESSFARSAAGHFMVDLPKDVVGSYAIAIGNLQSQILADWIITGTNPPANTVKNGSFEDYLALATSPRYGYGYMLPDPNASSWHVRQPDKGALCSVAYMEVQLSRSSIKSQDGQVMMELNSYCADKDSNGSSNPVVFQKLSLKAGRMYQFRFWAVRDTTNANVPQFDFLINGKSTINQTVKDTTHVEFKTQIVAETDDVLIEFQELDVKGNGQGTIIDNVQVLDLGVPVK